MSLSANLLSANSYYAGETFWKLRMENKDSEEFDEEVSLAEKDYTKLKNLIKNNNLIDLINSDEFKQHEINYRFGIEQNTLLHAAYRWNKPEIIEYLLNQGADERIPDDRGLIPLEVANDNYTDSLPRIVNEIAIRYFDSLDKSCPDPLSPHLLFEVIQNFISEKKWKYYDTEGSRKIIPFRDGRNLSSLGLPNLSYHVNCADLANLFIKSAHKIGLNAKEVKYNQFQSIQSHEKETRGIIGKFQMFDGSENLSFDTHFVAYSCDWHFDLTLMCKYKHKNAILKI